MSLLKLVLKINPHRPGVVLSELLSDCAMRRLTDNIRLVLPYFPGRH